MPHLPSTGPLVALVTVGLLLQACTDDAPAEGVEVADGWTVEVVRDDLEGPTQLAKLPSGDVLVAELAGGEGDGEGRVLALGADGAADEPQVLLEGLLTPTGVAARSPARLWVQEQVDLREHRAVGDAVRVRPDAVETTGLVTGLPSNGRSQGSVTVFELDGEPVLLATATGTGSGPDPAPGSGELYAVQFDEDGAPVVTTIATGFKNAYAHVLDAQGDLYVTEVGDGSYDGEPPLDELVVIPRAVWIGALAGGEPFDGGWPRCTGDGDPTEEFGATDEECAALEPPLLTFDARATPTSVAVTRAGTVVVALWVEGRVVEFDRGTGLAREVLSGVDNPQHLLALPDGSVLLTVHGSGELWRLVPGG